MHRPQIVFAKAKFKFSYPAREALLYHNLPTLIPGIWRDIKFSWVYYAGISLFILVLVLLELFHIHLGCITNSHGICGGMFALPIRYNIKGGCMGIPGAYQSSDPVPERCAKFLSTKCKCLILGVLNLFQYLGYHKIVLAAKFCRGIPKTSSFEG